ncbi:MAG: hypothetical protein EDM71_08005 [Proteobacteria bacterium]|nr:MAG: hypothetical protein EDM71_08005 [Pseudomonadota bacterium]MBC6945147.1 hypothetical protein [Gammaproteobacteria bacterium]MCE7897046.1 hypothetical protein [Gammaproteobacteria bacterium PRO8]MCQ3934734.1 hypothetical protein [Gammaproteobacteria bacterium]MDL1880757.1 hypothetical protein [Gammaproteobacteria bacterium PRO2]
MQGEIVEADEKIQKLREYKDKLHQWQRNHDAETRSWINENTPWVRRETIEAGCFFTMTISPPPAVGGLVMQNVDPFAMMFSPPYLMNLMGHVVDMIDKTIGVLKEPPREPKPAKAIAAPDPMQKGYAFIAMPIDPSDTQLEDVLDAIKEAAKRCGVQAERIDEPHSNERITDRILESIRKAEYVIVDLTGSRPNVFYEAGYAQGLRKTPIYIAREGTRLEFDLKDYPVIFFKSMKELKDLLERRLRGLAESRAT